MNGAREMDRIPNVKLNLLYAIENLLARHNSVLIEHRKMSSLTLGV